MPEHKWLVKHPEVEEAIDLAFYRPIGYGFSRVLCRTPVTPDQVTVTAAVVGVASGHLFLYGIPALDVIGCVALVASALLDSVDGQLARLRGSSSRHGRMHDGMSDSLVFISVYLHLAGRLVLAGAPVLLLPAALALVANQFLANALADLYRNAYLRFALRDRGAEGDFAADVRRESERARRERAGVLTRVLFFFYLGVARQQELLNPALTALRLRLLALGEAADVHSARYATLFRPLLPHLFWLGTNVRVLLVLVLLPLDAVALFFWANLTVTNAALWLFVRSHERRARRLLLELDAATPAIPACDARLSSA